MNARSSSVELLDESTVVGYLVSRGLLSGTGAPTVAALGGGVSNVVLAVEDGERRMVVKQALPRLRVAAEWIAKQERAMTEAAALEVAAVLAPGHVPAVLDADPSRCVLTIESAPRAWGTWKDELLAGETSDPTAARVGRSLALLHSGSSSRVLPSELYDREAFDQLRVDPYYRTVMRRHPRHAAAIAAPLEAMLEQRICLVHGDFSPKNILVGDGSAWLIDFEVAHVGDPAFDVAFLLNHLLLKAINRPAQTSGYRDCAVAFEAAYAEIVGDLAPEGGYVSAHVGCLLLARVDGKSPAEYLTAEGQRFARKLALILIAEPPPDLGALWDRLAETAA